MDNINPVVRELIDKTFKELNNPPKPIQRSRVSNTPNGYIHLIAWSNACLYRIMVRKFTDSLPKSEHRLKSQFDDNARSTVANIEEGFSRPTTLSYLDFLGYSRASLIEGKGDTQRGLQDGLLKSVPESKLSDLGINLADWHRVLKESVVSKPQDIKGVYGDLGEIKGNKKQKVAEKPFKFNYPPVDNLKAGDLTYEMFIEIINKTDWCLRGLVVSLEQKMERDQKYYQVEQARIRGKLRDFRGK